MTINNKCEQHSTEAVQTDSIQSGIVPSVERRRLLCKVIAGAGVAAALDFMAILPSVAYLRPPGPVGEQQSYLLSQQVVATPQSVQSPVNIHTDVYTNHSDGHGDHGHIDNGHTDSSTPHTDTGLHIDIGYPPLHIDTGHQDVGSTHTDSPHNDVGHADSGNTHGDSHKDISGGIS